MRLIDADKIVFDYSGLAYIPPHDGMAIAKYFFDQIKAMPIIAPPPNDPLTLEELREMDGEPVWIVGVSCINNFNGHWDICDWEDRERVTFSYCMEEPDLDLLGVNWFAYRRKKEGQ